jgi:hypothetical protein
VAERRLPVAERRLPVAERRLPVAERRLPVAEGGFPHLKEGFWAPYGKTKSLSAMPISSSVVSILILFYSENSFSL